MSWLKSRAMLNAYEESRNWRGVITKRVFAEFGLSDGFC